MPIVLSTGQLSSAVVTLHSLSIFKTHEWFKLNPTIYFQCKGENKTVLPDVKKAHVIYTFKGQESWQPLTNFSGEKCKRCGFYEQDTVKTDDVLDEWELCPSDFSKSDGRYTRNNDKEFNATFTCSECVHHSADSNSAPTTHKEKKDMHVAFIILISVLVSTVFIFGLIAAYKYWLKKKREQEQARFLKLFEDDDDIEDELGLDHTHPSETRSCAWEIGFRLYATRARQSCTSSLIRPLPSDDHCSPPASHAHSSNCSEPYHKVSLFVGENHAKKVNNTLIANYSMPNHSIHYLFPLGTSFVPLASVAFPLPEEAVVANAPDGRERSRDQGSFDTGKTKRMSSVCISNCIRDTRAPLRATYMNLYKWPESDAEFMRSMSFSGVPHHWPGPAGTAPRVVHSISCRQMYLRSYPFSREEDKGGRRAMCFSCCGKQGGRRDRRKEGRRRTRRPCQVLRKVTDMSLVALFRIFHRLLSCSASVDVVD
ncbi:hypothetical protein SAY87_027883 [Trapa incisa]|uniref:DUF7953 domain-containing protein n=1 Tax=Trapa incisa TaxID=236973 RepID=A0AAN7QN18_9MYRT|nr:hypothetical protein SAY87_027883 [Trapa incisa]